MILKLLIPTRVLMDEPVSRIVVEAENGQYCLLPRHIDFLAAIVPGILTYVTTSGGERFVAVDEGLLVKQGKQVWVSTRQAVLGGDLGHLRDVVRREFENLDERQRICHSAIAALEANFLRRFLQLEETTA